MTIIEFLEARITEDEAVARDRPNSAQIHYSGCYYYNYSLDANWECDCDEDGAGTRRLLAECAAKRAIIAEYEAEVADVTVTRWDSDYSSAREAGLEVALRALAAVYKDHADYDKRWAL